MRIHRLFPLSGRDSTGACIDGAALASRLKRQCIFLIELISNCHTDKSGATRHPLQNGYQIAQLLHGTIHETADSKIIISYIECCTHNPKNQEDESFTSA